MKMKRSLFKHDIDRVYIIIMALFSVISSAVFVFTNVMLPAPFAEIVSIGYYYANASDPTVQSAFSALIYGLLYLLSLLACVVTALSKNKGSLFIKAGLSLVIVFDLIIHSYAFLFSSGYNWNYLVAAVLEAFMIVSVFFKGKEKNCSGDEAAKEKE